MRFRTRMGRISAASSRRFAIRIYYCLENSLTSRSDLRQMRLGVSLAEDSVARADGMLDYVRQAAGSTSNGTR